MGPLTGLLVVDLTRVLAGPFCTMLLADLGARVIKVEIPEVGDDSRQFGPFIQGESGYFLSLNRGKESIALNLKSEKDRAFFERLVAKADVLVENFRPGTMAKLGYDWETLHERFPRLVVAAISGFGQSGPYARRPAYDAIVQGMGGMMSITGTAEGETVRVGTSIGDITAALFAANGIQSALFHRERSGEGSFVDIAMLDCQVALLENAIARCMASGQSPGPLGTRHPSITPFDAFATADGKLIVAAGNDALFQTLCEVLELSDLPKDPRFSDNASRTEHVDALKEWLEGKFRTQTTETWLQTLLAAGIPCGPIQNVQEVLADPQVQARNMLVSCEHPIAGTVQMAGNPMKFSCFEDFPTRAPAPALDQHRAALWDEFAEPSKA